MGRLARQLPDLTADPLRQSVIGNWVQVERGREPGCSRARLIVDEVGALESSACHLRGFVPPIGAELMSGSMQTRLGSVVALWRYPVKSMMGEELNRAEVTERGLVGDRAYALVDGTDGKVASA